MANRWLTLTVGILTSMLFAAQAPAADMTKLTLKTDKALEIVIQGDKQRGMFIDGATTDIFSVTSSGKMVRIAEGDKTTGFIDMVDAENEIKIKDSTKQLLFKLKKEPDGRYKLKSANGDELCKLTPESYGFKIKDKNGQELYKVHNVDGKITLKTNDGKLVMETHTVVPPLAVACFGMDALKKQQKAALAYTFAFVRN